MYLPAMAVIIGGSPQLHGAFEFWGYRLWSSLAAEQCPQLPLPHANYLLFVLMLYLHYVFMCRQISWNWR